MRGNRGVFFGSTRDCGIVCLYSKNINTDYGQIVYTLLYRFVFASTGFSRPEYRGTKKDPVNAKASSTGRKLIREYVRHDTIYNGIPIHAEGHTLKYDRTVRDTRGNTYSISNKTDEVMKLHDGIWQAWHKGINGKVFYLYADAKGNVFAHPKENHELYLLNDSVWVKISDKFLFRQLIPGADGQLYNLNRSEDANKKVVHKLEVWKDDMLKPLEGANGQRLFYEEYMKMNVAANGTIFLTGPQKVNDVDYLMVYEWKNAQWKKIGEFVQKYFFSVEKSVDSQNRFYISYDKDDQTFLRRWDGNAWSTATLPRSPIKYLSLSNNLTGELFCKVSFPQPLEYYHLQGEEWVKLTEEPFHIIPKYTREIFPQIKGHYYKTQFGDLYDLGTEYIVQKRNLKEYPFVIPASLETMIPDAIKRHLAQFVLLEDNGKKLG